MDSSSWTVADHSAHPAPEDDFQQYLDMNGMGNLTDGINYNFQDFQPSAGPQLMQPHAREQLDIPMSGTDAPILLSPAVPAMQHHMPTITTSAPYQSVPATMMPPPTPNEAIVDTIDAQIQFLQQQKMRHQQRHIEEQQVAFFTRQQSRMVPPTPQSLELQPGTNHYYAQSNAPEQQQQQQQQQQAIEYRYQRLKDQADMSFTPLVSPAVTPLDTHFSVDSQFAVSGAYFSPLTSPALHAQTDPLAMFDQLRSVVTTSSPVDMELDSSAAPTMSNMTPGDLAKKMRKNAAKARAKAGVKQSPISKPLRRRTTTTPSLNAQVLSELAESAEQNQDPQLLPTPMMQNSSSSTTGVTDSEDSVSPEALNDMTPVEMPPPPIPKPRSARPSPYIAPQPSAVPSALQPPRPGLASPATPASLMKLSSPSTRSAGARADSQEAVDTDHIETFELPESANFSNRTAASSNGPTPTQSSQDANSSRTPSLAPLASPSLVKPPGTSSATQSPQLLAGSGFGATRKTPQLLPRGSKKRGSVSSIPVSPALRPKISPSIKPLLPGGPDAEEAASHLLATKSNYQRILEGNTLPGVSYPSELSTNLTSKRTSHKIAEQGRRNRINSALQEIATLLPRPPKDSEGEGSDSKKEKEKDKNGAAPNSKASTVEMAIEYIKQLQQEVAEANRRAEEAEKKLGLKADGKAAEGKQVA
ncbi:helix-loop-helix DNA-binding domain-containing protein [Parachaetomium inaequale]|uniref:Helix-loop-helix DNA-binding domain-containing protein n=1 Tax=Parachaetomium inaequale TaxID=2588326 RepID=A0AAN6SVF4_9PEZI|nr:helix-loop-helix DNA-binding domain-containing protein [Parachaetomium inaequale]